MVKVIVVNKEAVDKLIGLFDNRSKYYDWSKTWEEYDHKIKEQIKHINENTLEIDV